MVLSGLYTVQTRYDEETKDLTFLEAMRLIQKRFEEHPHDASFASIKRQTSDENA